MNTPLYRRFTLAVLAALATACGAPQSDAPVAADPVPVSPPEDALGANFIEGLGDYHFPITTEGVRPKRGSGSITVAKAPST